MTTPLARIPLRPGAAAAAVARLATAVEHRARAVAALIELHRAHLEHTGPGRSRSAAEHALDLVALGLRCRQHAPPRRSRPGADERARSLEDLDRLVEALAARRHDAAELSRLAAWRDFARAEHTPELVESALELAAWFEAAVDAALPSDVLDAEEALALVRTELVGRALRRRTLRPCPQLRAALRLAGGRA